MKNNIRDTNNKELQEIIANTILLPDISNLDCLHEPITASFGLLLLYAQLYHYSENKERLFSKIVDATNLLCTPGNICDITMGCTDGCSEGCEPGEPSETHSYCGAACR